MQDAPRAFIILLAGNYQFRFKQNFCHPVFSVNLIKLAGALQLKRSNESLEFSAMARKVVIRQLLTAAVNKGSGDQILSIPLGKGGGVATSMESFS